MLSLLDRRAARARDPDASLIVRVTLRQFVHTSRGRYPQSREVWQCIAIPSCGDHNFLCNRQLGKSVSWYFCTTATEAEHLRSPRHVYPECKRMRDGARRLGVGGLLLSATYLSPGSHFHQVELVSIASTLRACRARSVHPSRTSRAAIYGWELWHDEANDLKHRLPPIKLARIRCLLGGTLVPSLAFLCGTLAAPPPQRNACSVPPTGAYSSVGACACQLASSTNLIHALGRASCLRLAGADQLTLETQPSH